MKKLEPILTQIKGINPHLMAGQLMTPFKDGPGIRMFLISGSSLCPSTNSTYFFLLETFRLIQWLLVFIGTWLLSSILEVSFGPEIQNPLQKYLVLPHAPRLEVRSVEVLGIAVPSSRGILSSMLDLNLLQEHRQTRMHRPKKKRKPLLTTNRLLIHLLRNPINLPSDLWANCLRLRYLESLPFSNRRRSRLHLKATAESFHIQEISL